MAGKALAVTNERTYVTHMPKESKWSTQASPSEFCSFFNFTSSERMAGGSSSSAPASAAASFASGRSALAKTIAALIDDVCCLSSSRSAARRFGSVHTATA